MPIGIVSDMEFMQAIDGDNHSSEIRSIVRGRGLGNTEVPDSLRKVIGEESVINGRSAAIALAETFNISPSSVSAYGAGSTSTASYKDKTNGVGEHVKTIKDRIKTKAEKRVMAALNALTPEKISEAKPRDIAAIAKDMASVVKDMDDSDKDDKGSGTNNFIFYAPRMKAIDDYEVIQVVDNGSPNG